MIKLGTIMLYLKKMEKIYDHVTYPLISACFHLKSANLDVSRNADRD